MVNRVKGTGKVDGNGDCTLNWFLLVQAGVNVVEDGLKCCCGGSSLPKTMLVVGKVNCIIDKWEEESFKDLDCWREERNRSVAGSLVRCFARFRRGMILAFFQMLGMIELCIHLL